MSEDIDHDGFQRHGGTDALGVPRWDFSTNANACGPAPMVLEQVRQVDARRAPDPDYRVLRQQLARLHQVEPERIVLAASPSEFVRRMTLAVALLKPSARVQVPDYAYGDYVEAAEALGLQTVRESLAGQSVGGDLEPPRLIWHAEPGNPMGDARGAQDFDPLAAVMVVNRTYAPLRLDGEAPELPSAAWQLWSPNKALGLSGVRGAYAIAPVRVAAEAELTDWLLLQLQRLAPTWPLGVHAVAMLNAWASDEAQSWVQASLHVLRGWRRQQLELCQQRLGWTCLPSVTPFYLACWGQWDSDEAAAVDPSHPARVLPQLRALGVKLRDCSVMGLPGWVRVSVQGPPTQNALSLLWRQAMADSGFIPTVRQSGWQRLSTR